MNGQQGDLLDLVAEAVDERTAAVLELVAGDHLHVDDRRRVVEAILGVARDRGGRIDPNLVREKLTDTKGNLCVYSRVVGATYNALARRGVIRPSGWTTNDDRSGNRGKPCRLYELVDWSIGGAA